MKALNIKQNTAEWLEFRRGRSGGSSFRDLWVSGLPTKAAIIQKLEADGQPLPPEDKKLTVAELANMLTPAELAELKLAQNPKKRYYEMIAERVAEPIAAEDYADRLDGQPFSLMARGHLLEGDAIKAFEAKTGKTCDSESVVWVDEENPNIYISPDAVITTNGVASEAVEVKCLSNTEIVKACITKTYPKDYEPQFIKYFSVNPDLETLYVVLYTDRIRGLELQIFPISRADLADKIEDARAFEMALMEMADRDTAKIIELDF